MPSSASFGGSRTLECASRAIRAWLPSFAFVLALGCGSQGNVKYDNAEVTGTVRYKGQAVTGGRITFTADQGGLAQGENIDEKGNYKVNAPVGAVHITVDTSRLNPNQGRRGRVSGPILKNPNESAPEPFVGTYVQIPKKYSDITQTDLTFIVKAGSAQTFNIELKD